MLLSPRAKAAAFAAAAEGSRLDASYSLPRFLDCVSLRATPLGMTERGVALPSAGAIAPGTPVQDSAVRYRSIRPLRRSLFKICVAVRAGFTPGLNLVPGTLPQARQRLRFGCLWKLHRRKSRRPEQRIHQRAVLCAQARDIRFKHADISAAKQPLKEVFHVWFLSMCYQRERRGSGLGRKNFLASPSRR